MAAGVIILMGPTGAGKSFQAEQLAKQRGWASISSGELLRATTDPHIRAELEAGELVETRSVEKLVETALRAVRDEQGIVLDGFPRELREAAWLSALLPQLHRDLEAVIYLEVPKSWALERLEKRKRSDDDRAAIEMKWHEYETETKPVIEHFQDLGKLHRIDGSGSQEVVASLIAGVGTDG